MAIWKSTWRSHYDDGTLISNSLHWVSQPPVGGTDATADAVLNTVQDHLTGLYLACLCDSVIHDELVVGQILPHDSTDVPDGAVHVDGTSSGDISSGDTELPKGLVLNLSLQTGVPRRWARGYMSLPCPLNSTNLNGSGEWDGTFLLAAIAFAAHMDDDYDIGSLSSTSLIPVVYSRVRELTVGIDDAWAQVQGGVARQRPSWRRSRMTSP